MAFLGPKIVAHFLCLAKNKYLKWKVTKKDKTMTRSNTARCVKVKSQFQIKTHVSLTGRLAQRSLTEK